MLRELFKKSAGDFDKREIGQLQKAAEHIDALELSFEALDDAGLRAKTDEFRQRLADGETLDDILVEAFAAVREAAKRALGMRHYDVQMIGGMILHRGDIAEMKTGEGKTLVATLPLYLNALEGKGAHLVTPNDYLSKVGVQWMGPIYRALGLSVGVIQSAAANPDQGSFLFDPDYSSADDRFLSLRPVSRREAYQADVTYGTNNEFGFDYLRDNMARDLSQCVQRELHYAIVDEVDNILIDEARTPLIISGPAEESSDLYSRFADVVRHLRPSTPESVKSEEPDGDYALEEKTRIVTLTEQGVERVERVVPEIGAGESIYDPKHAHMLPYLDNALRAYVTFKRDKDYVVSDGGEVIIVDEFTGRLMHGRRFSEGLHQAIEAKEGVQVQRESLTYATITFQNYFRMYEKLAGMTGTAKTEEEEFQRIYNLDVVVLPTNVEYRAVYGDLVAQERVVEEIEDVAFAGVLNGRGESLGLPAGRPVKVMTYELPDGNGRRWFKRLDLSDVIYATEKAKFRAVVDEIEALYKAERPVLVGTIAIETSERLSRMLKRRGVEHQVLNAKYHEKEAIIIAQAGRPGAVTIATNMAGRGVDIKLGGDPEGVARERLRREGIDLTEIPQADWNHALEMLREGQDVSSVYTDRWAGVLAEALADCAADHERVVALGGLHILGTERHEARRIDNQLRGRAGRQGDPGSSRFYISLEDDLMRRFGGERVQGLMGRFGVDEVPIQHSWLDRSIESAQVRVEGYNFDIRKHVLEYDDVVNKQREVIYAQRREVLSADDLCDQVLRMVQEEIGGIVAAHTPGPEPNDWDLRGLYGEARGLLPLPSEFNYRKWEKLSSDEIEAQLFEIAERAYDELNRSIGHEVYRQAAREDVTLEALAGSADPLQQLIYRKVVERLGEEPAGDVAAQLVRRLSDELKAYVEAAFLDGYRVFRDRQLMLRAVDSLWVRHLTDLDELREGIRLRAYGQQNPLVAYRKEAFEMYEALLARVQEMVARSVYLVPQALAAQPRQRQLRTVRAGVSGRGGQQEARRAVDRLDKSLGRNDPCWCGSGRKYKNCHMRQDTAGHAGPIAQQGQAVASRPSKSSGKRRRQR
jgi:preprotein translocase subunit SecA